MKNFPQAAEDIESLLIKWTNEREDATDCLAALMMAIIHILHEAPFETDERHILLQNTLKTIEMGFHRQKNKC